MTSEAALFAALERIGRIEGLALSGTDRQNSSDVALTSPFRLSAEIQAPPAIIMLRLDEFRIRATRSSIRAPDCTRAPDSAAARDSVRSPHST